MDTSGMNQKQRERFDTALKARPFLGPLVERLQSIGGKGCTPVVWNEDEVTSEGFIGMLLGLGRVSSGRGSRLRTKGCVASGCHRNSIALARKFSHRYQREIGFAMSADDKNWRPHSWIWDAQKNQIVETTELRSLYFGVTLAISKAEIKEAL